VGVSSVLSVHQAAGTRLLRLAGDRDRGCVSLTPEASTGACRIEDLEQSVAEQAAALNVASSGAVPPSTNTAPRPPRTGPVKRNRGTLPAESPRVEQVIRTRAGPVALARAVEDGIAGSTAAQDRQPMSLERHDRTACGADLSRKTLGKSPVRGISGGELRKSG
jgi:hypothetical protein